MGIKEKWDRTMLLLTLCERYDTSVTLEYDTGRFVDGKDIPIVDGKPDFDAAEEYMQQGPRGWTVEVGGESYANEDDSEILYPSLEDAATAGLRLLQEAKQ